MPSFRFASATGSGSSLIVTCSDQFAGKTITCTNGTKTYTRTCPSTRPYEVVFKGITPGTWTVSGVVEGITYSSTITIIDFETNLNTIPEGSTAVPTDDIQTWLHCANIWDKNYTTISQVLADASTLQALIASNNAADYMARSTTWATDVTADQSAMSYIGLNDYCSDVLLSDSTWLDAICNSTYFESVLNVKVPTMTSNTTPSGEAYSNYNSGNNQPYKAFDNDNSYWYTAYNQIDQYIGYMFPNKVKIYKLVMKSSCTTPMSNTFTLQASKNSKTDNMIDLTTLNITYPSTNTEVISSSIFSNSDDFQYYRIFGLQGGTGWTHNIRDLKLYGRASS